MNTEIVKAEKKVQRSLKRYTQLVMSLDGVKKKDTKPKNIDKPEKQLFRADGLKFDVKVSHNEHQGTMKLKGLSYTYFKDALLNHYIEVPIDTLMNVTIKCVNNGQVMQLRGASYSFVFKALSSYHKSVSKNWESGSKQLSFRKTKSIGGFNPDKDYLQN